RKALDDGGAALRVGQVDGRALRLGRRHGCLDLGNGVGHCRLGAPVDDDGGAHAGQADGGGEADALARAGDEGDLSGQVQIDNAYLLGWSALAEQAWLAFVKANAVMHAARVGTAPSAGRCAGSSMRTTTRSGTAAEAANRSGPGLKESHHEMHPPVTSIS